MVFAMRNIRIINTQLDQNSLTFYHFEILIFFNIVDNLIFLDFKHFKYFRHQIIFQAELKKYL